MSRSTINVLPEELQLHIFDYLDSPPPSELQARQEPSLQLVRSTTQPLKVISQVSKRWRRIILPLLFRHACLRLDTTLHADWSQCSVCADRSPPESQPVSYQVGRIRQSHAELNDVIQKAIASQSLSKRYHRSQAHTLSNTEQCPDDAETVAWATRFYHALIDFIDFIQAHHLQANITSFVLVTDRMLSAKLGRFPAQPGLRDWRYHAAASLWQHLLSVIDPERIAIMAPPMDLACLTNASIDTFGDWAFSDMNFHTLELQQDRNTSTRLTAPVPHGKLAPFPQRHPGFAESSLIHLRDWTHVGLNEGSFLKAYGTYEYFERGPPSLVASIKQCFTSESRKLGIQQLPALRSFTYIAIFPFANHVYFANMLPHLEELDVQFAPDPQSGILDDKERTGKAELQDCWQELISAYQHLAGPLSSFLMHQANHPRLKRFICQDSKIPALQHELDEIFTTLCLPVWAEIEPGVFKRLAMSPGLIGIDDGVS